MTGLRVVSERYQVAGGGFDIVIEIAIAIEVLGRSMLETAMIAWK